MADTESVPVTEDQNQVVDLDQDGTSPSEDDGFAGVPKPKVIEVERKFVVTEQCKAKLLDLGAELLEITEFTDKYFDVADFSLTTQDFWLRTRNGRFELKYPVSKKDFDTPSTQYHELDTEEAILGKIVEVLNIDPGSKSLTDFLADVKCNAFSCYTTKRLSYGLDEFAIVLDEADFGFSIGEIERIVVDESRISEALVEIDSMAEKLGFVPFATAPFADLLGQ